MRHDGLPGTGSRAFPRRPRLAAFLLAMGALLWLAGCFREEGPGKQVAGGTGSEAGDAYGRVLGNGPDLGGGLATVTLYRSADSLHGIPEAVDTVTADSLGLYRFRDLGPGTYDLEFRGHACECGSSDYGDGISYRRGVRFDTRGDADLGIDTLAHSARLGGKLDRTFAGSKVRLAPAPYEATVDSAGSFRFPFVPRGEYRLVAERNLGGTAERSLLPAIVLAPGDSLGLDFRTSPDTTRIPIDTARVPVDTTRDPRDTTPIPADTTIPMAGDVMIEDFADGDSVSRLGKIYGGGRWTFTGTGTSNVKYFFVVKGMRDNGLLVQYYGSGSQSASTDTGHVRATLPLGDGTPDLSKTDTLAFHAKGKGRVIVTLWWNTTQPGVQSPTIFPIDLTANWAEFRRDARENSLAGGLAKLTSLNRMEIVAPSGAEFYLDEIRALAAPQALP